MELSPDGIELKKVLNTDLTNGFFEAPASVRTIAPEAFLECTELTSLRLLAVTEISEFMFSGHIRLTSLNAQAVTEIGESAFAGCTGLTCLILPKVTKIGAEAFANCDRLTSLNLPEVTEIGAEAFANCIGLTSFDLPKVTEIGDQAFTNCRRLTSFGLPKLTKIGDEAFARCIKLTSLSLPAVTKIDRGAFKDCHSLTSFDLPKLTKIGDEAFAKCIKLTSLSLPAVTKIDRGAFADCHSLTSLSLPAVTQIGSYAFYNCTELTSIRLSAALTEISKTAFNKCSDKLTIICPDSKYNRMQDLLDQSLKSRLLPQSLQTIQEEELAELIRGTPELNILARHPQKLPYPVLICTSLYAKYSFIPVYRSIEQSLQSERPTNINDTKTYRAQIRNKILNLLKVFLCYRELSEYLKIAQKEIPRQFLQFTTRANNPQNKKTLDRFRALAAHIIPCLAEGKTFVLTAEEISLFENTKIQSILNKYFDITSQDETPTNRPR